MPGWADRERARRASQDQDTAPTNGPAWVQRERLRQAGHANVEDALVAAYGSDLTPEAAQQTSNLARQTGVPFDVASRNQAELQKRQRFTKLRGIMQDAPDYLRTYLSDPRNVQGADLDDVQGLKKLARAHEYWRERLKDQGSIKALRTEANTSTYLTGLWTSLTERTKATGQGSRMVASDLSTRLGIRSERENARTVADASRRIDSAQGHIQMTTPQFESGTAQGVYSGLSSTLQQLPALAVGAATGGAGALALMGGQVGLEAYGKYRARGGTAGEALLGGGGEAAVEVATELGPTKFLLGALKGTGWAKKLGYSFGSDVAGEQVATMAQDALDTAIANPDATWAQYWAERPEAAYQTFIATLTQSAVMGGGVGALRLATRQQEAQAGADVLDTIMATSADIKQRQNDPEGFRAYIDGLAQGTPIENVHIPAEAVRALFQDGFEADDFWNGYAEEISEAEAIGGDVVIPLADVATHLAGTPQWDVLKDEARFSAGGMSLAELASLEETYRADIEQQQGAMAEQMRAAMEAAAPAAQVFDRYNQAFLDAGFRPDVSRAYAMHWAENRRVRGEALGMNALEYDQQNPVEITRRLPEKLAGQVRQADGLDIAIAAMRGGKAPGTNDGPSLVEFIASKGGVEDVGGDIASMGGNDWHRDKKFRRKLLKDFVPTQGTILGEEYNPNSIENLFAAAIHEGYFPDLLAAWADRAEKLDTGIFLEAVGAELSGAPIYRHDPNKETETARVREAAEELRRVLIEADIDPDTATRKEIEAVIDRQQAGQGPDGRALEQYVGTFDPADPRILHQNNRGRVSGGIISGTPGPTLIELFDNSDLSSVIHETSHVWLEELERDAAHPDAPDWLRRDWQTVQDWFAENGQPVAADGTIPVEAHEMFARAGEQHAMEGKAPSSALRSVFAGFRRWLLRVYEVVQNLRTPLNDEVRRVFDRMVATQDEIDAAADHQNIDARFANAAQAGMTEAQFAAYRQVADEARNEAYDALLFRTMASLRRERTAEWKAQRAKVREEVAASVHNRPMFRAYHLLRTGRFLNEPGREPVKVKLDREWLVERYGADALGLIPKMVPPLYKADGQDADLIAEMSGFASGDEMVRALMGIEQQRQLMREAGMRGNVMERVIDDETAAIMEERYGNPLDDGSIEDEAMAAIHNDSQGDVIAAENRALSRRTNKRPTAYSMAREWARQKVASGRVVDVASRSAIQGYARAQAKAANAFEQALLADDVEEAFRQSEIRLINHALIVEAKKAADLIDKAVERLGKIAKTRTRKSIDQGYLERAHALLAKFEFRPRSQKALDEMAAFADWAAGQAALGIDVKVPPRLEADGEHWSRVTVEELIGLDESVAQLIHLGRKKQEFIDAGEKRDFDQVVAEAIAVMESVPQRKRSDRMTPTRWEEFKTDVATADAALLKMERVIDWLDADDPNGVFNRLVFQPLAEAQHKEREMIDEYIGAVKTAFGKLPKGTHKRWAEPIRTELLDPETGRPFVLTRQDLVSAALNIGNEGNLAKLVGGYRWNEEALMRVLEAEMRPEDWAFVQEMWDLVETLWPQIEAMERRVNGVAPPKVERREFSVTSGGQTIQMAGGYYPVVYDPTRDQDTKAQAAKNDDLFSASYGRATTSQGFTKERTQVKRPVLLSLSVLNRHLGEVIHDITHREPIMQADKLLSDRRIIKAATDAIGAPIFDQFRPWLRHVANEWAVDHRGLGTWERIAKSLRSRATMMGMGLRLTTIVAQGAGYAGIMEMIGPRWMASGAKAVGDPTREEAAFEFVMSRSKEVPHRMSTMDRDINANLKEMQGQTSMDAQVRRFAFHGIGYADRAVAIPGWLGAYNKALHEGMIESEAIHYADKVIRSTQGAGAAKDLSAVQRATGWQQLATMFYSYAAAFYNRQRALGRDVSRAAQERDAAALPGLLARSWWLFAVSPLLGSLPSAMMGGGGPEDDETWTEWAAWTMFANLFYGIPLVRDVAGSIASGFDYSFTPAQRIAETGVKAGEDVVALVDGDEETEPSDKSVKTAVEAVGYAAKLPLGQVANALQFISDWASGEVEPDGVGEWLSGLQRGKLEEDE